MTMDDFKFGPKDDLLSLTDGTPSDALAASMEDEEDEKDEQD